MPFQKTPESAHFVMDECFITTCRFHRFQGNVLTVAACVYNNIFVYMYVGMCACMCACVGVFLCLTSQPVYAYMESARKCTFCYG